MKTVCSWCQKVLKKGKPPVSHGICPACRAVNFPDKKERESADNKLLALLLMRAEIIIKKEK
jgi:phage FluMu protein Com